MNIYTPYTYLIGWTSINKFYYGVRYAKSSNCIFESGCHPSELWVGYFTSSTVVAEYRKLYGEPDIIQVRKTFDCPKLAQEWECKVIDKMNMIESDTWLNEGLPGAFIMTESIKKKISESNKKPKTKEHALNISKGRKGLKFTDAHIENIRKATTGVKQSQETIDKRKQSLAKLKWWNNGTDNVRSEHKPVGEEWTRGRVKGQWQWKKS